MGEESTPDGHVDSDGGRDVAAEVNDVADDTPADDVNDMAGDTPDDDVNDMADDTPADEPPIALIAAVAANGVIGVDGGMPWHLPADLRRFKRVTMGNPVIMGRRTYESIAADLDGPLPGRMNIVLSRGEPDLHDGVVIVDSVEAAIAEARAACALDDDAAEVFVIGGASVYEQFLPRADRLVLTELEAAYDGDTRFPDYEAEAWVEQYREAHESFDFVEYERRGEK
jgi:dihydrofolate reductase